MVPQPEYAVKPLTFFKFTPLDITDYIRELSGNIATHGLFHPPLALDTGEVLAGRHRLTAMMLAGMTETRAAIYPSSLTKTQRRTITVSENLQHKKPDDPETYRLCKELMALNPEWKRQDLAAHLNKSPAMVTQY